jgi:hypothetical protein
MELREEIQTLRTQIARLQDISQIRTDFEQLMRTFIVKTKGALQMMQAELQMLRAYFISAQH